MTAAILDIIRLKAHRLNVKAAGPKGVWLGKINAVWDTRYEMTRLYWNPETTTSADFRAVAYRIEGASL
jgi:hypothetical protein